LKQTPDQGMGMNPSTDICKIDAYPDADFAGINGHKKPVDPSCVKSCTGFVISFTDVTIFLEITTADGNSSFYNEGQNHSIIGVLQRPISNH
jgi:hypothetical protein